MKENENENEKDFRERAPAIPIDILDALEETKSAAESRPKAADIKRCGVIRKIASAAISAVFCGVTLIYMTVQTAESADRLFSKGADAVFLGEVFGGTAEDKSEETKEDPPQNDGAGNEETAAETEISASAEYPIVYESLANHDLLTDMSNETAYDPDMPYLLGKRYGVGKCGGIYEEYGNDAPAVLIVHTHGTEAYTEEGKDTYTEESPFRSANEEENVVAVGDVIAEVLEARGVNVIHCREMFDKESYRDSYSRSYAAVASYLEEYPSLFYVIDVHRDSIIRDDKTNIATYAEAGGRRVAQAMIVVGTNEGGADHETWEKNLSLALNVQYNMTRISESVPRKINLRSAAFNQGLSSGSLLLEIGSCANTLDEAKCTAAIVAEALACAANGEECDKSADELLEKYCP